MGLRTLSSLQKVLLAVIIFILVGYVGYFVTRGSEAENTVKSDFSVSTSFVSVCNQANNGKPNGQRTDTTCGVCRCFAPPGSSGETVGLILSDMVGVTGIDGVMYNFNKYGVFTISSMECSEMWGEPESRIVCAKGSDKFLLPKEVSDIYECVKYEGAYLYSSSMIVYPNSYASIKEYAPYFETRSLTDPACSTGLTGGTGTGGVGTVNLLPGCGVAPDGTANQCGAGGSLEGQCVNDEMWRQGFNACVKTEGGGGGIQAYPKVKCTNLGSYVDPTTGKTGKVKCSQNQAGEDRVCYETRPPVRGDANTGNGKCVEKNNAAGQICKYGVQCARETEKAPGLAEEYEVTERDMRCEKRDKADGGLKNEGICMPRYNGEEIGCGMIADGKDTDTSADNDRDNYCKEQFAQYRGIEEGENEGKDYERIENANNAYCHKVKNAAGNYVEKRFECRLQRGEGKPCNPNAGNQCFSGLSCTKVAGKNKYTCQTGISTQSN